MTDKVCLIKRVTLLITVKPAYVVTSILKRPLFLGPLTQNTVQMNLY